jgi:hypothetical protein
MKLLQNKFVSFPLMVAFALLCANSTSFGDEGERDSTKSKTKGLTTDSQKTKPWNASVTAGGGYNSNVINLGDVVPLPSDISHKDAGFGTFGLNFDYNWKLSDLDTLKATYNFQSVVYNQLSAADSIAHTWSADLRHKFSSKCFASLEFDDQFLQIDGNDFRNQWGFQPAVAYKVADWTVSQLAYSVKQSDFLFTATPAQTRDALTHSVAASQYIYPKGTKLEAHVGYFHTWNDAGGADFNSEADGYELSASHPIYWKISGTVTFSQTFDEADNANSITSSPGGLVVKRRSTLSNLGIQLDRPIMPQLDAYARYDHNWSDSNIGFFEFVQDIWTAGVIWKF